MCSGHSDHCSCRALYQVHRLDMGHPVLAHFVIDNLGALRQRNGRLGKRIFSKGIRLLVAVLWVLPRLWQWPALKIRASGNIRHQAKRRIHLGPDILRQIMAHLLKSRALHVFLLAGPIENQIANGNLSNQPNWVKQPAISNDFLAARLELEPILLGRVKHVHPLIAAGRF